MSIQLKRSLSSDIDANYVLKQGQIGIEMPTLMNSSHDSFKLKIGDGATKWSDLPYFGHTDTSSIQASLDSHVGNTSNPHGVTAAQVGAAAANHIHSAVDVGALPVEAAVGELLEGKTVSPTYGTTVIASTGAEIFNDFRTRTFHTAEGHAAISGNVASGAYSHAEGYCTTASGQYSHAEGGQTVASGKYSHVEGMGSPYYQYGMTLGLAAHAEGCYNLPAGEGSHAEGFKTWAKKNYCHTEGAYTIAEGYYSHAEGSSSNAVGDYSHAEGSSSLAENFASHACGKKNKSMVTGGSMENKIGDVMVVGNGSYESTSNAFRITYAGETYGLTSFKTSGADYAEYFEWQDGNPQAEDRVGRFVTMSGKHIKTAAPGDYILGVVSGQPCIIGNADEDWLGRWEHDDFGRFVKRYMVEDKTEIDPPADEESRMELLHDPQVREEDGKLYRLTSRFVDYETSSWDYKPNPDYDSSQPYIERRDRKEWDAVGMLGVLPVWDDGSCQVDGWCRPAENGTATAAESFIPGQTYRVIERVSENVVKLVFR